MNTILEILETIKPGADFASSTDFIEEHLLESMEILQLVSELNDEFDINLSKKVEEGSKSNRKSRAGVHFFCRKFKCSSRRFADKADVFGYLL